MKDIKKTILVLMDQVWRKRWMALATAWVFCLLGWSAVSLMPDQYVSEARFYVDTNSLLNPLLKGISVNADDKGREQEVAVMQRTLTSRPNLLKVAQMTDLDKSAKTDAQLQKLLDGLEDRITIKAQGPNLFLVQYTDNSPEVARNVVQALLTIFVESSTGNKREDIQSARAFIDRQIADYETQLKAAEQRLAEFKKQNVEFVSFNSQSFGMRLEQAQEAVKNARLEYAGAMEERDQIRRQLDATPRTLSVDSPMPVVGGTMMGLTPAQRVRAFEARLAELEMQFTAKHPDVIATKQALQKARAEAAAGGGDADTGGRTQVPNDLHNQLAIRLTDAETRVNGAKRKLDEAQSLLTRMELRASEAPQVEAQMTNLDRDYQVLRSNYESLLQRRESARISAAADSTTEPIQFRIVAAPEVPSSAAGPKRLILNTLVLLMGLGAGIALAVVLVQLEDPIASPEDLADLQDYRVLGWVSTVQRHVDNLLPRRRLDKFGYASAGLAVAFVFFIVARPNFSAVTQGLFTG